MRWNNISSQILLKELPSNNVDLALIHNNLGYTYQKMNKFPDAMNHLNISIDLYLRPNAYQHINRFNRKLASAYNNKGLVHSDLGEFTDALEYINNGLSLRHDDATLPENERKHLAIERSCSHENLGIVYRAMCNYKQALYHLEETLHIRNNYLPPNHYMIAQVYNNLSIVYCLIGNPLKSLECTELALTRQIQSLPENHPHRAAMYNSLGEVYYSQGQYPMALLNFEKALSIYKNERTGSALRETVALSNIGSVMIVQENYDGALQIFLQSFATIECEQPRHPRVALCLNNIGFAYRNKGDHSTAITYFNRALKFCQSYLPENSETTAISYLSVTSVLTENEYDLAVEYFEHVISIYNHIGLPHHQNIIRCHIYHGRLYRKMHDHQSALAWYKKAIFHCENAPLPQRHPLWVMIYTSSATEYHLMGDFSRTLIEYEYAIQHISDDSLEIPRIHSEIDLCRRKIIETDVRQTIAFMLDTLGNIQ
ncbi:unnamed protein product [Rotaria magnacalcarata]